LARISSRLKRKKEKRKKKENLKIFLKDTPSGGIGAARLRLSARRKRQETQRLSLVGGECSRPLDNGQPHA